MDRQEALVVLQEVLDTLKESVNVSAISFDDSDIFVVSSGFEIRLRCELSQDEKEIVDGVLKKHNLRMMETKGLAIIYTPKY